MCLKLGQGLCKGPLPALEAGRWAVGWPVLLEGKQTQRPLDSGLRQEDAVGNHRKGVLRVHGERYQTSVTRMCPLAQVSVVKKVTGRTQDFPGCGTAVSDSVRVT